MLRMRRHLRIWKKRLRAKGSRKPPQVTEKGETGGTPLDLAALHLTKFGILPGKCYIAALPYEVREEIVFYAVLMHPRWASLTIRSIALTSRDWTPHARRLAFTGLSLNLSPWRRDRSLARFRRARKAIQDGGVEPCRAVFIELPFISATEYGSTADVRDILGEFGPTLWSLEVQNGCYSTTPPYLGPPEQHTGREAGVYDPDESECKGRGYMLPQLQRLWVQDLEPDATIALIRATGEHERDCHHDGPVRARRPKTLSIRHAFESWTATRVTVLSNTTLRGWWFKDTDPPPEDDFSEVSTRDRLDIYVGRKSDMYKLLRRLDRIHLPAGIKAVEVWQKEGEERIPEVASLINEIIMNPQVSSVCPRQFCSCSPWLSLQASMPWPPHWIKKRGV